jgi:hypothetical protein
VNGVNNFNITTGNVLELNNPANTFKYQITPSALAADRILNLPLITGTDTLATLGLAQTFTGANTHSGLNAMLVSSSGLTVRNPANTFKYTITAAAIAADRILNLPLITSTTTIAVLGLAQTFLSPQTFSNGITFNQLTGSLSATIGSSLLSVGGSIGVYRTTNAGANITPQISLVPFGLVTAGTSGLFFETDASSNNALTFAMANGTRMIARGQIKIDNPTNTAGSEAGDLGFYTQTAGAAPALRITIGATALTLSDAVNLAFNTTTGTKIGTATTQKLSFWNATPVVQPTTAIAASTFVANTSAIANDTATFDGYTIGQIVKALRTLGILA